MKITICDVCEMVLQGAIYKRAHEDGDYCETCVKACPHEENIDGTTHGVDGKRLICKECGYDRVEAVTETVV